jgi:sulfoxide reductase heme-binding subunit YedZ
MPLLYLSMFLPSYELVIDLISGDRYYAQMMHTSGVVSVYLLVLSMAVTPLTFMLKRWEWGISISRWLLPRRRHFGLGSFYYASLHLVHYIRQTNDIENMFYEALDIELTIAWIAFLIFTALAITSNNASVSLLKTRWKKMHNLVYIAAALTFIHWLLYDFFPDQALMWIAILLGVKAVHIGYKSYRRRAHIEQVIETRPL